MISLSLPSKSEIEGWGFTDEHKNLEKDQDCLYLSDAEIKSKSFFSYIKLYPNLRSLNLTRCQNLSNYDLERLLETCSKLENISLAKIKDNQDKLEIKENVSLAKRNSLIDCQIKRDTIEILASHCTNLKMLHLDGHLSISLNSLQSLGQACQSLQELNLIGCSFVSPKTQKTFSFFTKKQVNVVTSAPAYPHVETLNLVKCVLNKGVLLHWAKNSPYLQKMDLKECRHVDTKELKQVMETCRNLQFLSLSSNPFSKSELTELSNQFPQLKMIFANQ